MIRGKAISKNGQPLFVLGITREEVRALQAKEGVLYTELDDLGANVSIIIDFAETQEELAARCGLKAETIGDDEDVKHDPLTGKVVRVRKDAPS